MGEYAHDFVEQDPELGYSLRVDNPAPEMAPAPVHQPQPDPIPRPDPEPQEADTDEAHSHRATIGSRHRRPNNAVPSGRSVGS
ncbi:hypothetical protein FRC09_017973 [Ceratobasidium sp. 395]|nr:hypothetical protein FRC09_017973 [Ceratobasidium sp. 395]